MKRTLIASILGIATVATSYGQGVVAYGNYGGTPVTWGPGLKPAGVTTGSADQDNGLVIGLYAGQGILSDSTALTLIATCPLFSGTTSNVTTYGWYDPSYVTPIIGNGVATVPFFTGTQSATFQVRATGAGSANGEVGASTLWTETPFSSGGSLQVSGSSPVYMLNGPTALVVNMVPEPTTFALLGLGAASMLIFRKRQ